MIGSRRVQRLLGRHPFWPYYELPIPTYSVAPAAGTPLYARLLAIQPRDPTPLEVVRDAGVFVDDKDWLRVRVTWALCFVRNGEWRTLNTATFNAVLNSDLAESTAIPAWYRTMPLIEKGFETPERAKTVWDGFRRGVLGGRLNMSTPPNSASQTNPGQLFTILDQRIAGRTVWEYADGFRQRDITTIRWLDFACSAGFGDLTRPCGYIGSYMLQGLVFAPGRYYRYRKGTGLTTEPSALGAYFIMINGANAWREVIRNARTPNVNAYRSTLWQNSFQYGTNGFTSDNLQAYQAVNPLGLGRGDVSLETQAEYDLRLAQRRRLIDSLNELNCVTGPPPNRFFRYPTAY